jgi:cell division protein FtsI (penicillin-binding protein 3)
MAAGRDRGYLLKEGSSALELVMSKIVRKAYGDFPALFVKGIDQLGTEEVAYWDVAKRN